MKIITTINSTFAIGGVTCFDDTFVVKESSVLRIHRDIHRDGTKPTICVAAKRYLQVAGQTSSNKQHHDTRQFDIQTRDN